MSCRRRCRLFLLQAEETRTRERTCDIHCSLKSFFFSLALIAIKFWVEFNAIFLFVWLTCDCCQLSMADYLRARYRSDSGYDQEGYEVQTIPSTSRSTARKVCTVLFQCLMCLLYLGVMLLGLITMGTFTREQNDVYNNANRTFYEGNSSLCVLFADRSSHKLGPNGACSFVTWGEVIVVLVAALFIVCALLKAICGKSG